jgi:hypothetical protein
MSLAAGTRLGRYVHRCRGQVCECRIGYTTLVAGPSVSEGDDI